MTTYKDNIGKEDIRQFGGNNRTFQRRNSAGALLTLHSVGNVVDVLQVFGDGSTPAQTDLSDAIVGANGNEVAFELAPGTWPITSDLTIPSTVTLILLRGATFSVSAGVTLTLSGPVIAQESTWYSGSGTVVYTAGGGYFPLVSDLASVAAGKGAALIGATGTAKTVGDLFDGGKDVTIKPLNIDAGGTLAVAGASTVAAITASGAAVLQSTLDVTGQATVASLSASGTLGGKLAFRGARVTKSADQSISTASLTAITFNAESYDTDAIHDNATNNTRLTVPAGVSIVSIYAALRFTTALLNASAYLRLNGTTYVAMGDDQTRAGTDPAFSTNSICFVSLIGYPVSPGDYFELIGYHEGGAPFDAGSGVTYFQMTIES